MNTTDFLSYATSLGLDVDRNACSIFGDDERLAIFSAEFVLTGYDWYDEVYEEVQHCPEDWRAMVDWVATGESRPEVAPFVKSLHAPTHPVCCAACGTDLRYELTHYTDSRECLDFCEDCVESGKAASVVESLTNPNNPNRQE